MKTKIIVMGVLTALLVAVTFKLKSNKQIVDASIYRPDVDKHVLVQASLAKVSPLQKTLAYTGTFSPYREVMIVPQVHGEVDGVYFEEGEIVKQGDLLVQIDDELLQQQLISAEASYQTARRNLERYENASLSGGVSKMQLDNLNLNLVTAESQLKQLGKQIELCRITAPFTGTVTLRDVEVGSVTGGQSVARVTDLTQLKLEISVPEREINFFKEGDDAEIGTDVYSDKVFKGKVEYVSDRADNAHNYTVRILVQNSERSAPVKAGMYGTAFLKKVLDAAGLIVPRSALLGSAKNPQVYIIEGNRAVLENILVGQTMGDSIEVLEGLNEGDTVVTTGHINLATGSLVEIVSKK